MALRCSWTVKGGIILGEIDQEFTRRFELTAEEWNKDSGVTTYLARQKEADDYFKELQDKSMVGLAPNWARIDFIFY